MRAQVLIVSDNLHLRCSDGCILLPAQAPHHLATNGQPRRLGFNHLTDTAAGHNVTQIIVAGVARYVLKLAFHCRIKAKVLGSNKRFAIG